MHRIIKSHLDSFSVSHGYSGDEESEQFEKFCNYSIITSKTAVQFDVDSVSTSDGDDGIDGVAILIDEEVVVSKEDCEAIFKGDKRNHDVELVLVQAKTTDGFDLGDFLKFKEATIRLVSTGKYKVSDDVQMEAKAIFEVVMKNVPKIRGGRPNISTRFVTTGVYKNPDALVKAEESFKNELGDIGIFEVIDTQYIDRDALTKLWVSTYSGTSAEIEMFSLAPLPKIDGVEEAYIGVVRANELINRLLIGEDGGMRGQVFEENVRSFLGVDNPVNASIASTIGKKGEATRFPVLNNGITIVSPDVRVQGTHMHLDNYQIVNGCQTSHVLWENRKSISDDMMLTIKVVETTNEDIFAELVRATNSQSKVEETQFYSLRPIIKRVEKYFDSFNDLESRLYFERRDRQFVGKEIPAIRIFNLQTAAKSVCAMFSQRPDLSFRYHKKMYEDLGEELFSDDVKEIVYYSACLALYRINLLRSNGTIPKNILKYKWHILPVLRAVICADESRYALNSNKTEKQCEKVVAALKDHGAKTTNCIKRAIDAVIKTVNLTDDRLKRQAIVQEMIGNIE